MDGEIQSVWSDVGEVIGIVISMRMDSVGAVCRDGGLYFHRDDVLPASSHLGHDDVHLVYLTVDFESGTADDHFLHDPFRF